MAFCQESTLSRPLTPETTPVPLLSPGYVHTYWVSFMIFVFKSFINIFWTECDLFCKKIQKCILLVQEKAIYKYDFLYTGWPGWHSTSYVQSSGWTRPPWVLYQSAAGCAGVSSSLYKYGGGNDDDFLLQCLLYTIYFRIHSFCLFLCCPEELSVWHESLRSFPLLSGGEDCMPAVTKGQIYPTSGLHGPAARSHGPGN